jgi:hypothetical protein
MQVARYRERHSPLGAKSDQGDAHLLADIVRLDRAHHRPVAGDTEIAEHIKVAARAHQTMIWSRVRQVNTLRSMLREYYPAALAAFGADLARREALAVLAAAPSPDLGRRLSLARLESLLRKAGRQRNVAATAAKICKPNSAGPTLATIHRFRGTGTRCRMTSHCSAPSTPPNSKAPTVATSSATTQLRLLKDRCSMSALIHESTATAVSTTTKATEL